MLCCESKRPAPRSLLNMFCRGVVVMFFHVSGGPSSFSKIYFLNCLLHLLKLRRHMPTSNMISTLTARMPRPRASFSEIPTSCRLCWHTNLSRTRWRRLVLERPRAKLDVCSGKELKNVQSCCYHWVSPRLPGNLQRTAYWKVCCQLAWNFMISLSLSFLCVSSTKYSICDDLFDLDCLFRLLLYTCPVCIRSIYSPEVEWTWWQGPKA